MSEPSTDNEIVRLKNFVGDCFTIFNGVLLILMHVGYACMEVSRTRPKFTPKIYLKIFLHLFVSYPMYWLTGYGLSLGKGNAFVALNWWKDIGDGKVISSNLLYEYLLSALPVTILSGTITKHCNPIAFVANSIILSGLIQPVVKYWVWNNCGWLQKQGFVDFSGAGVIFAFAGGLCFTAMLLVRAKNRDPIYSPSLFGTGAVLVVIGFLVLNCGALYRIPNSMTGSLLSKIVNNVLMAGASGCVVSLLIGAITIRKNYAHVLGFTVNGALSGMVAVCGGVNTYSTLESTAVAAFSACIFAILYHVFSCLKVHDTGDAFGVYFGGGLWGMLATNLFASKGILHTGNTNDCLRNLLISLAGTMAIFAWSAVWTIVIFSILTLFKLFERKDEFDSQEFNFDLNSRDTEASYIEALPYSMSEKNRAEGGEFPSFRPRPNPLRTKTREQNFYENLRLHTRS